MKVVIIGGGPAGMIAGITSKQYGCETIIIEKNNILGKKLLITGKGRCNITSSLAIEDFISNIPGNGKFLYSAFQNFDNNDIINMLKDLGVNTKVERGNRVFPTSDKASSVRDAFKRKLQDLGVEIIYNKSVRDIMIDYNEPKKVKGVILDSGEKILADKVIIATGGKSYPGTGSTGDGYILAKKIGHTITKIKPSLVPLTTDGKDLEIVKEMQGLSLRNIAIKITDTSNNKEIYNDFGELLFTHFGFSGPTILSSSSHLNIYNEIDKQMKDNKIKLSIDLKPALSKEHLEEKLLRELSENKIFKNYLHTLLPNKMIKPFITLSGINENKKINEISKEQRHKIIDLLKDLSFNIKGFRPIEEAIITSGGISTKEINPKTMESKNIKGLFFAGEVIDIDAYTGGFNLQIAYSTGFVAGKI